MSTRSNIAIKLANGKVESIYCHWDGYYSYNGRILLKNYNKEEKVKQLIALGDISSLREKVAPPKGKEKEHSFDHPIKNVTIAYHRDRKEKFTDFIKFDSEKEYFVFADWAEYKYLFKDGKWFVKYCRDKSVHELTPKMCEKTLG